jgi:MFS family permease
VDRFGPDGPLRICLVISFGSVPVVLLFGRDPHLMLLGSFIHGLGAAAIWPAVISAWTRDRSPRERAEIMGQILTGWMAGLGLGVILGNMLAELTGRAELVVTYAPILLWLITLAAAMWSREPLGKPAPSATGPEQTFRAPFPPELRVMAIGLFLQNMAFGSLILAFRFLVLDHLEMSSSQLGLLFLLGGVPAVLLLGPMGRVADRVGRRGAVIRSMFLVGPLVVATPFLFYVPGGSWARFAIMLPGLLAAGVAYAFMLPAWHALALERIPEEQRGRSLGLLMSVEMAALASGHVVGPILYEKVNFGAPFVAAGGVFVALAVLYQAGYILPREGADDHLAAARAEKSGGGAAALSPNGRDPDTTMAPEEKRVPRPPA